MTKDETLRLALDTLKEVREETFRLMRNGEKLYAEDKVWSTIISVQEALETRDEHVSCAECGVGGGHALYCVTCAEKFVVQTETKDEFVAWEQFYPDIGKPQIAFNAEVVGYVAPQRTWVGLTDEEIKEIGGPWGDTPIKGYTRKMFDKIEAKLREKNQ